MYYQYWCLDNIYSCKKWFESSKFTLFLEDTPNKKYNNALRCRTNLNEFNCFANNYQSYK